MENTGGVDYFGNFLVDLGYDALKDTLSEIW